MQPGLNTPQQQKRLHDWDGQTSCRTRSLSSTLKALAAHFGQRSLELGFSMRG